MKVDPWPGSLRTPTRAAVGLDERADDVQAQAQALPLVAAGGPLEPLEDPPLVLRGDPDAPVLHLQDGRLLVAAGRGPSTGRPAPYLRALESRLPTTCSSLIRSK